MPDDELLDFALATLEHAARSVTPHGGPLTPFTMIRRPDGQRALARFLSDTLEDSLERARTSLSGLDGPTMVAVAWDGYLTADGVRTDAVLVEASAAGADHSSIFGQRYQQVGRWRKTWQTVGQPALVGHGQPLF